MTARSHGVECPQDHYDARRIDDGRAFVAMQLVAGVTLRDRIQRAGRSSWRQTAAMLARPAISSRTPSRFTRRCSACGSVAVKRALASFDEER